MKSQAPSLKPGPLLDDQILPLSSSYYLPQVATSLPLGSGRSGRRRSKDDGYILSQKLRTIHHTPKATCFKDIHKGLILLGKNC